MFGVQKGDVYDKKSMHKRLGIGKEVNPEEMSVSSLYQNNGYLASQIEPAEIVVGRDSIDLEIRVFEGKALYRQRGGHIGQYARRRRSDPPRALCTSGRSLQPRHAHADHTHPHVDGALRRRERHARRQAREQRAGRCQLASGREGERPVQYRRRLGLGNVRRFDRRHAQQPLSAQLLQEGRLAPLPFGTEPAPLDFGTEQRYIL